MESPKPGKVVLGKGAWAKATGKGLMVSFLVLVVVTVFFNGLIPRAPLVTLEDYLLFGGVLTLVSLAGGFRMRWELKQAASAARASPAGTTKNPPFFFILAGIGLAFLLLFCFLMLARP